MTTKKSTPLSEEKLVNGREAAEILGCGLGYITTLKKAMGLTARKFFVSRMRKYLRDHPDFISSTYYPRKPKAQPAALDSSTPPTSGLAAPNQGQGIANTPPIPYPTQLPRTLKRNQRHSSISSDLGCKLKALRGQKSAVELAYECGISREAILRIERGGSVKISTLRKIADGLKVSESVWRTLLVSWIRSRIGEDFDQLKIEVSVSGGSDQPDLGGDLVKQSFKAFEDLNTTERGEILHLMHHRELIPCVQAINTLHAKLQSAPDEAVKAA